MDRAARLLRRSPCFSSTRRIFSAGTVSLPLTSKSQMKKELAKNSASMNASPASSV